MSWYSEKKEIEEDIKEVKPILIEMEEKDNAMYRRLLKNAEKKNITPEEYFIYRCIKYDGEHEYDPKISKRL